MGTCALISIGTCSWKYAPEKGLAAQTIGRIEALFSAPIL